MNRKLRKRRRITGGMPACQATDSSRLSAHLSASFPPRLFCVAQLPRRNEVVSGEFTTRITTPFRGGFTPPKHGRYAVWGATQLRNAGSSPGKTLLKRQHSDDDGYYRDPISGQKYSWLSISTSIGFFMTSFKVSNAKLKKFALSALFFKSFLTIWYTVYIWSQQLYVIATTKLVRQPWKRSQF